MANIALNKPSGGQLILSPEDGTSTETVTIPSVGVGKVLQMIPAISTAANDLAITTDDTARIKMDSFSITVKEGSSVIMWYQTAQYIKSIATTNIQIALGIDGVVQSVNTVYNPDTNHIWYSSNTYREETSGYLVTPPLSAGTHTIDFFVSRYNSGTLTMNYQSRKNRYLLMEVAA